jgi:hypothetical protein
MSQVLKNLQRANQLTSAMIQLVEDEAWDELAKFEHERDTLINQVLPVESMSYEEKNSLEQLHQLNQQLQNLCSDARHDAMVKLKSLSNNKKAVSAYTSK